MNNKFYKIFRAMEKHTKLVDDEKRITIKTGTPVVEFSSFDKAKTAMKKLAEKYPDRCFVMVLDFGTMSKKDIMRYRIDGQHDVHDNVLHFIEIMSYNVAGQKDWSIMSGKYFVCTSEIVNSTQDFVDVEEACKAFDIYENLQVIYKYGLPSRYSIKGTKYNLGSGLSLPYYTSTSIYYSCN